MAKKIISQPQEIKIDRELNKIYVYKIKKYLLSPPPYSWKTNMAEIKKLKALLNEGF